MGVKHYTYITGIESLNDKIQSAVAELSARINHDLDFNGARLDRTQRQIAIWDAVSQVYRHRDIPSDYLNFVDSVTEMANTSKVYLNSKINELSDLEAELVLIQDEPSLNGSRQSAINRQTARIEGKEKYISELMQGSHKISKSNTEHAIIRLAIELSKSNGAKKKQVFTKAGISTQTTPGKYQTKCHYKTYYSRPLYEEFSDA
jgi:hypothetical protein